MAQHPLYNDLSRCLKRAPRLGQVLMPRSQLNLACYVAFGPWLASVSPGEQALLCPVWPLVLQLKGYEMS